MRYHKPLRLLCVVAIICTGLSTTLIAQGKPSSPITTPPKPNHTPTVASVLTNKNDPGRTGANNDEKLLNTSNVNSTDFGKLFERVVDGDIYAQPLYVPTVTVPGKGVHNVVYVATQHNSLYAFDADDPNAADPLWHVGPDVLGPSVPSTDLRNWDGNPYKNIYPEVGITSTPVIDYNTKIIYVVNVQQISARNDSTNPYTKPVHEHRLWAFDIQSGENRLSVISPTEPYVKIKAKCEGCFGEPTYNRNLGYNFDSVQQIQRAGLLISGGYLYVAFASYADVWPYHGWVLTYDLNALIPGQFPTYYLNTTPDSTNGGIWQAGVGPAADDTGNIYFATGNGTFDPVKKAYSDSFVRVSRPVQGEVPTNTLRVRDSFTPYNQQALDAADNDLGSSGPIIIPGTNLMTGGGKEGKLYLMDRSGLGGYCDTCTANTGGDTNVLQWFQVTPVRPNITGHIHGSPIYYDSPAHGPTVYIWGENDYLRAYNKDAAQPGFKFVTTEVMSSTLPAANGMPGGLLSLSSDANTAGTGIVWASRPYQGDANAAIVPGMLLAFDADDLSHELWNSKMVTGDDVGKFAKFNPPTIANGKVFLGSFSKRLNVYGLKRLIVTSSSDDGLKTTPGTLSYSLDKTQDADTIYFNITDPGSPNKVTLAGANLPKLKAEVNLMGTCGPDGPAIIIDGNNRGSLTLEGGSVLYGLQLKGFGGPQLKNIPGSLGPNKLSCVKVTKT